jgi:hypothetical protein
MHALGLPGFCVRATNAGSAGEFYFETVNKAKIRRGIVLEHVMKQKVAYPVLFAVVLGALCAFGTGQAAAETVTGKKYSVYIYSRYVPEPAATITFKADGVLLLSSYSGFGKYFSLANGVAAVFSAPEYQEYKDLFMVIAGATLGDFIYGAGVSFTNGSYSETFLFSGYVAAG